MLSGPDRRAGRDGCDCPEAVTRCAHLPDGRRLVLGPNRTHALDGSACEAQEIVPGMFCVWLAQEMRPAGCGVPGHMSLPIIDKDWLPRWLSWDEANAEFERRFEELLAHA